MKNRIEEITHQISEAIEVGGKQLQLLNKLQQKIADKFTNYVITSVSPNERGFDLGLGDHTYFHIPNNGITPKVGQTAVLYGNGFGHTVRGVDIDDKEVFYRTETEEKERFEKKQKEEKQKRLEQFEANKDKYFVDIAKLPEVFQLRFDKFRKNNPEFDVEFGDYELFCCEQAVLIASALKTETAIRQFDKLKFKTQCKKVPGLSDGHSGNTFGASVHLALWYVIRPEMVDQVHGALSTLIGCKEYGCHTDEDFAKVENNDC
jgi:hypothetical protein